MQDNNIIQEAIDTLKRLYKENAELKAENERLKKLECKFKEYCTCNTEKYIQTLQEIKVRIPEDYKIYQWYEDVIQLIIKAEEK